MVIAVVAALPGNVLSVHASQLPKGVKQLGTVEDVTEYRLDNGLRVLLYPDESTPKVTVNLTVLVGSRHEGYGETGMAHLLEHMLFKGTSKNKNIPKALRDHGAEFNATTSYDRTNYYETLRPSTRNLEFALALEADRFVNSMIRREDLLSEMTVVRNEFESGENNPNGILSQRIWASAYEWHNYGKNTIGNRSDIERVPIDNLKAFYKKYYRPDNAVLIVTGNFDAAKALPLIAEYFGPLKNPARELETTYTDEPAQDGERQVSLRRVGTISVVGAAYHIPAASQEDFAAVEVLNQILSADITGRLYRALVEGKKCSQVSGYAAPLHDPSLIEFSAQVLPGESLDKVRATFLEVLEGVATNKPTHEEVVRARRKLLKDRDLLMNKCERVASALNEAAAAGDWRLFFLHRDRIAKVTPEDVAAVAARYLKSTNRTVGVYVPTKEPERAAVPATPDVEKLVSAYSGGKGIARGERFDPTAENIEKRTQRGQLSSGVKTALLPKKTRAEAIVAQLTLRYGNEKSLQGLSMAADMLPTLLSRGTKKHTREQIEDELDRLNSHVTFSGGLGSITVSIQTRAETLEPTLKLVGEMLHEPSFPAAELEILKGETLDSLKSSQTDPEALASLELQRKLAPYPKSNIRYVPTLAENIEMVETVKLEQISNLYKQQVGGTVGELAMVGNFDPKTVTEQFETLLKGWKSETAYERIDSPALEIKGERVTINTPDKENAIYVGGQVFGMKDNDPDYPALLVGNFVFGGGALSSRLADRVRQKEGLSYSVGSSLSARSLERHGSFTVYAICNPENISKVNTAVLDELEHYLKDGIGDKELREGKEAFLEDQQTSRSDDSALVGYLGATLHAGRTFAYYAERDRQIAALTVDQVNAAFRKFISPRSLIIVEAGDFKKK